MREMKDSGIKWIGTIPKDWNLFANKYIFNIHKQIVINSTKHQLLSLTTKGVKYKNIKDTSGKVPDNYDGYQVVKKNDLVMCLFDLDCSAVFSGLSKYDGMISPAYKLIKEKIDIANINFFEYWFRYVSSNRYYKQYAKNLRYTLNADEFLMLKSVVPTLHEQKLIAEFLDKKCVEIDGITKDLQTQIETLENYKKSVITEAVTKGLNHNVEIKSSPITWAKNIPSHWEYMPNKYIMTKIKKICPVHNDEDIISLSMNGVVVRDLDAGGKMPTTFNGYQFVYPGNLLMCLFDYDVTPRCIGYINNHGITSPAYSQFKMKRKNCAKYYYYYYLMIDNTKELLHLAKNLRHSFTEDELGKIYAIVPPVQEQKEIANYLDKKCAEIEEIIKNKKEQLETIEEYKKSLIYEYVTGKKEVKNA